MLNTQITYPISVNTAINVILLTNKNDITLRDWNFFSKKCVLWNNATVDNVDKIAAATCC